MGKKIKERMSEKPMQTYVEKPPELLLQDANKYLMQKNYILAAEMFEEIDKQHPYSKVAKKSMIMAAYAYYLNKDFNDSVFAIDRFINLHPADKNMPYALYLKGMCYFERIDSVNLDQEPSENAKKIFEELIKRFPNSIYTKDAKNKILIAYEPVWSIGTNKIPKINELENIIQFIKKEIKEYHPVGYR